MSIQDTAYLLHQRHLSDSRVIVELLTEHHGRVAAGWRRGKGKAKYTALQPFRLLHCVFYGGAELKTLKHAEASGEMFALTGEALYCGLYTNEILMRSLCKEEACPDIFQLYAHTLLHLAEEARGNSLKSILRGFEFRLLNFLGYGIDFSVDSGGQPIVDAMEDGRVSYYRFVPGEGFSVSANSHGLAIYSGAILSHIGRENWCNGAVENAAKQISRAALQQVIGDKPLKSRELYRQVKPANSTAADRSKKPS